MNKPEKENVMHSTLLPEKTYDDITECYTMHYIVKPGNAKKHVIMHDVDVEYLYHWMGRIVADTASKQFLDTDIWRAVTGINRKELPRSGMDKTYNSLFSYIGGLLSNRYRNPNQDFTKGQLTHIEFCFQCIYSAYGEGGVFDQKDLGYDIQSGVRNEPPQRVVFKEV